MLNQPTIEFFNMSQTIYHVFENTELNWRLFRYDEELERQSEFMWLFDMIQGAVTYQQVTVADPNPRESQHIGQLHLPPNTLYQETCLVCDNRMMPFISTPPGFGKAFEAALKAHSASLNIFQISLHRMPLQESIFYPDKVTNTMHFEGEILINGEFVQWFHFCADFSVILKLKK